MDCPVCHTSGTFKTTRTMHPNPDTIRRYRKCEVCGCIGTTEEVIIRLNNQSSQEIALQTLLRWGVSQKKARDLVSRFPPKTIQIYSQNLYKLVLDYQERTGQAIEDEAGYLVYCIENEQPLPNKPEATQSTWFTQEEYETFILH